MLETNAASLHILLAQAKPFIEAYVRGDDSRLTAAQAQDLLGEISHAQGTLNFPDFEAGWRHGREIIHFVGMCGAGKTTLSNRLAKRCAGVGGQAIGTIDWDPHIPDATQESSRAFSRELDRLNTQAGGSNPLVHQQIVAHTLESIASWTRSKANFVFVDRWYESYDNLPPAARNEIEAAVQKSGFKMRHVLLTVEDTPEAVRARMFHTKANRTPEWWATGPDSLDEWTQSELACQREYRSFCQASPFPSWEYDTSEMQWGKLERAIAFDILLDRWLDAFEDWWPGLPGEHRSWIIKQRIAQDGTTMFGTSPPRRYPYMLLDYLPPSHPFWHSESTAA